MHTLESLKMFKGRKVKVLLLYYIAAEIIECDQNRVVMLAAGFAHCT